MIDPKIVVHYYSGSEEVSVEQLSYLMHRELPSSMEKISITIGKRQGKATQWQDNHNWADAVVEQRTVGDLVPIYPPVKTKIKNMGARQFIRNLYEKEISVKKLLTCTSVGAKDVANFMYRFSAATAVEGTYWVGTRCTQKLTSVCVKTVDSLKQKASTI